MQVFNISLIHHQLKKIIVIYLHNFLFRIFTNNCGFEIYEDRPRYVLPILHLTKECVVGRVLDPDGVVGGHLPVGLYAMFQTVQLPTSVADLHSSLSDVQAHTFALKRRRARVLTWSVHHVKESFVFLTRLPVIIYFRVYKYKIDTVVLKNSNKYNKLKNHQSVNFISSARV